METEHQKNVREAFEHAISTEIQNHMRGRHFQLVVDGQEYGFTLDSMNHTVLDLNLNMDIPAYPPNRRWWQAG